MVTKTKTHEPEQEHAQAHEQQEDIPAVESFKRYLSNADKAITETRATITAANGRIEVASKRLDAIVEELAASKFVQDDFSHRVQVVEPILRQAQMALPLTAGTGLESQAHDRVTTLEADMKTLRASLEKARSHYAEHQKQAEQETAELHTQIETDTASIDEHEALLRDLGVARNQAHAQLGLALYEEIEADIEDAKAEEDAQEAVWKAAQDARVNRQSAIDAHLSEWPELRERAKKAFGPHRRRAQGPTERKLRILDSFLEELEISEEVTETPNWRFRKIVELFTFDAARLGMLFALAPGLSTWDRRPMDAIAARNRLSVLHNLRQQVAEYLREYQDAAARGRV